MGSLVLLISIGVGCLLYQMNYKKTQILEETQGAYTLTMYQVGEPGWPFGPVNGKFVLRKEGKKVTVYSFLVSNDGGGLTAGNAVVKWSDDCVKIRIIGEEQEDMLYTLGFDGTGDSEKAGAWYTDEEVISEVLADYGKETEFLKKEKSRYLFRAQVEEPQSGHFEFVVEQDKDTLMDNYKNAYFRYISDAYFENYYVIVSWQESGVGARAQYIPYFNLSSSNDRDIMGFCERFSDYVGYCIGLGVLEEHPSHFRKIPMTVGGIQFSFEPVIDMGAYDETDLYNQLYIKIDEVLHFTVKGQPNNQPATTQPTLQEISLETLAYYMTIAPSCSYQIEQGLEYRMVPVDRALGSNYYVLLSVDAQGSDYKLVNLDPYNGSGGESKWITFIDEKLGFSCLSHAAGAYGSLYRTEDGGLHWEVVKYPSAKAKLPDGTLYNPFMMPDKVYEKDGKLFMEVGQGTDGDYYDDEVGFCHGLYQSEDQGMNWTFVQMVS